MNKFKAVAIDTKDGHFHSMGEYARWEDLKLLEKAGFISGLKRQFKIELAPKRKKEDGTTEHAVNYIADFHYLDNKTNEWVTEDFKGYKTKEYKVKKAWLFDKYGIEIKETGRADI